MQEKNNLKRVLAAALLLASLSRRVQAETAVGLDAQGVDPLTALHNPHQLDVRDELGRPVSAAVIRQELGRAARGRAQLASFTSKLPKVDLLAALAEFFNAAPLAALTSGQRGGTLRKLLAVALFTRPEPKVLALLFFFLPILALSAWSTASATPISVTRSHRKVASLRI